MFGLVLRIVFISLHERPLFSDEKEYDQLAFHLASRASYSYDTTPTAYRPIGYPVFVGLTYALFGRSITSVEMLQALIDTAIAFLIYLLLTGRPERLRVFGATLWLLFAPAVFYSGLLLSETLFTFLFVLIIWMLTRTDARSNWWLMALGALLGALTLIKPTVAVFVFILAFLAPQIKVPFRKFTPIVIAFALVLTPWLIRNYLVFGEFALTSNGGINLMIGNNAASTGAYKYAFDPLLFHDSKNEFDVDHKALRYAARYIVSNPGTSVLNAAKKTARLFESEGALLVLTFHDAPEDATTSYGAKYASLPLLWILLANLSYFILVIGAIFGFLSTERDALWWLLLAALLSWILIHAVFFGGGRFHFPLMPLIALYAAQFFLDPRSGYRSLSRFRKVVAYGALTLFSSLWLIEAYVIFHA